jgi:hypothetical protein
MKVGEGYRHGDCGLFVIGKLPEGLKASKGRVLMTGSGGNDHGFIGEGTFYPHSGRTRDYIVVGYLVAKKGVKLAHVEHGEGKQDKKGLKYAPIVNGIYQVRNQTEKRHEAMDKVVD